MDFSLVSLLRRLSPDEYASLEASCVKNGVYDPIRVWNGKLVDGRHRLEIATKHNLPYRTEQMGFASEEEAKQWVIENQLSRRNQTEMEMHRSRAELASLTSVKEAAQAHGVSQSTISRDMAAANAMNMMDHDLLDKCNSGEIVNSMNDWKRYGKLTEEEQERTQQNLRRDPSLTLREAMPKKATGLSVEDVEYVNSIQAFSARTKMDLANGAIDARPDDIKKLRKLSTGDIELLAIVLTDEDITSLKKALTVLKGTPKATNPEDALSSAKFHLGRAIDIAIEKAKDVQSFGEPMDQVVETLKKLRSAV
jgi:hypothetical protein